MVVIEVLMIDDEKQFCDLVKMNLELTGRFRVWTAHNGKDGLKAAKQMQPNVILLDVMMPVMDGIETLARLKKDKATLGIPVIMLSAMTDDKTKIKTGNLYAEYYVNKPISTEDLIAKIKSVLNIK
jgi:two-component system alkaline phosphatase synthesis response regulator PhoP